MAERPINVQRYSQNHAQNWIFEPLYGGIGGNISALSESFNSNKLCSRVSSREYQFYSYNTKTTNLLFEPPFGGVGGNVHTSSIAR